MDIDVHSYQEELDTIVGDARAVLARMDEMKHRMDATAMRVDAIEHSLTSFKTDVEQRVQATASDVETFHTHAMEQIGQFDSQVTEPFTKSINDLLAKITTAEATFTQKSGEAFTAIDQSHSVVQQLGDLVKSTDHDVMDGVRNGIHALADDHAQLKQQFDGTTHPSLATLDDVLTHAQQTSETFMHETHDHLDQLRQQTDEHIQQELFQPMHLHLGETAQKLTEIASGDVDAKLHDVMEHTRQQLEDHAKQVISNLVDKVAQELDQVSDHIHKAGQGSAIPREAMKPLIDGIEQLIKPVEETIGNVKSIASAVGFDV